MYYQIKGLVLNASIHGEADKIASVYSYQWGKISLILPSAKKINAKLASAAEPITESEFMVYQNHPSVRPKAVGANILNNHSDIKSDFKRNIYALYAAEISGKLVPYNVENQEKYFLIARIWELLASCKNPRRAVIAFILRFLRLSGYSFIEYIGQNPAIFDYDTQQNIKKLSNCSGNDIDDFDFNDEKIWNCVEVYLSNYIKKPLVGTFLKKLNVI